MSVFEEKENMWTEERRLAETRSSLTSYFSSIMKLNENTNRTFKNTVADIFKHESSEIHLKNGPDMMTASNLCHNRSQSVNEKFLTKYGL